MWSPWIPPAARRPAVHRSRSPQHATRASAERTSQGRKDGGIPFEILVVEEHGSEVYAYGTLHTSRSAAGDKLLTMRVDARKPPMKGEVVHVQIDPDETHVFSAESGRRVSGDAAARVSSGASQVTQP
jgi:ABC-type sugar transport system ATPase subunit